MRARPVLALIAAILAGCGPTSGEGGARAELLSVFEWDRAARPAGGLSAIHVSEDGTEALVLSDRGRIFRAELSRDATAITGAASGAALALRGAGPGPLPDDRNDSEGLAVFPDGSFGVSFEGEAPVVRVYAALGAEGTALPVPRDFGAFQVNGGLEALAVGPDGALYAIPERSGAEDTPFPVFRYANGRWSLPFSIPRRDGYLAVGADIGPDGRFYLLERRFHGIFGFSTRLRRFELGADALAHETELLTTRAGTHDNLEGLSVWRDGEGAIRLLMVSDDNNLRLQTTELVEYRVTE